jgi:hypothetical protein
VLTGNPRLVDRLGQRDLWPLDRRILRRLLLDTALAVIREAAGKDCRGVELFDVDTGDSVGQGSMSLRVRRD